MLKKLIPIILISSTSLSADSLEKNVCQDLYRLTCSPGIIDDGTGKSSNATNTNDQSKRLESKAFEIAKEKFRETLSDSQNNYFRKVALSATGLSLHPSCKQSESKELSKNCLEMLASGVADIFARQQTKTFVSSAFNQISDDPIEDITFLTDSALFKKVQTEVLASIKIEMKERQVEEKIQKVFLRVKNQLANKIESQVTNQKLKQALIEKIQAVQFIGTDCSKDFGASEKIPGLFISNAFYDVVKNSFKYCLGTTVQNDSEFQMVFMIAHELAHGISPCGITKGPSDFTFKYSNPTDRKKSEQEFPFYSSVLSCLRDKRSIQAEFKEANEESLETSKEPVFCNNDQIDEAFADWMATELIPEYIENHHPKLSQEQKILGYSNVARGDCVIQDALEIYKSQNSKKFDVHPDMRSRVNNILLSHPKVREQMGCNKLGEDKIYCTETKPIDSQKDTDKESKIGVK